MFRTLLVILLAWLCGCATPLPRHPGEPVYEYATDGCSMAPDLNVRACCEQHDRAYWQGGCRADRLRADQALRACIAEHGHPGLARLYFGLVRVGGAPIWPTSWRWGFGWPYGMGYTEERSCEQAASSPSQASVGGE